MNVVAAGGWKTPVLPGLAGNWQVQELTVNTGGTGVKLFADPDPTRWCVIVSSDTTDDAYISSSGEPYSVRGIRYQVNVPNYFEYTKLGVWVQGSLFFLAANPAYDFSVVLISLPRSG